MEQKQRQIGFFAMVALAVIGAGLVMVPPWIASQAEIVSKAGKVWFYAYVAVVGTGAALFLGSTCWIAWRIWRHTVQKKKKAIAQRKNPSQLSLAEQEREFTENLHAVEDLSGELAEAEELRRELSPLLEQLESKQTTQKLEIVAFGAISSGKSALLNALAGQNAFQTDPRGGTTVQRCEIPWPGQNQVWLVDTPGLAEIDGIDRGQIATEAAKDADIVLLVVDGPLRHWEVQLLQQLFGMEKRLVVCLNKSDWYSSNDREALLSQIREQVKNYVGAEDIVAVRAEATQRQRVRMLADGSSEEETITVPPDISALADRMMQIVRRDGRMLLLANLLLQSRGLVQEAQQHVQVALDRRAWVIVDRYMWGAGSAAALSPWPLFDLAAGAAISTKMVVDLGQVYRQPVDVNSAVQLLGQLGRNLLAILGVQVATPAVAASVASLLKTVPGAGTIAGGVLQGVVQAAITRWIGAVFIRYFKDGMKADQQGLAMMARSEWERLTTIDELRRLVQQAKSRLMS